MTSTRKNCFDAVYLSFDGLSSNLGQSQLLPYLSRLSESGFTIKLICIENRAVYLENKKLITESLDSLERFYWQPLLYPNIYNPFVSIFKAIHLFLAAFFFLATNPCRIIHCRSYPSGVIGWSLKRIFKKKIIFDIRGFWPEERIEHNIWNLKKPFDWLAYHLVKKIEKKLYQEADHVITLTNAAKTWLITKYEISPANISAFPCATDFDLFTIPSTSEKKQFTVGYLGSLGSWYLLDEMFLFFKCAKAMIPDSRFMIVTNKSREFVMDKAKRNGVDPTHVIHMNANRKKVAQLVSEMDIGLCFIRPSFSKTASSPIKIGEYLASGVPVIVNTGIGDVDEHSLFIKGMVILPDFEQESLNKALNSAITFSQKEVIRSTASTIYSIDNHIKGYFSIYKNLLSQ